MEFSLTQEDAREYWLEITQIELADEDNGPDHVTFRLSDIEAVQLFKAVELGIGDYVREMRQAEVEFEASGWMLNDPPELGEGYELDDPKHPTYHDRMSGFYDYREGK